jgi:hypothetical protein
MANTKLLPVNADLHDGRSRRLAKFNIHEITLQQGDRDCPYALRSMQLIKLLLVDDGLALLTWEHGALRRRQGYASAMMAKGRLLQVSIHAILHANLMSDDFTMLLNGNVKIADSTTWSADLELYRGLDYDGPSYLSELAGDALRKVQRICLYHFESELTYARVTLAPQNERPIKDTLLEIDQPHLPRSRRKQNRLGDSL